MKRERRYERDIQRTPDGENFSRSGGTTAGQRERRKHLLKKGLTAAAAGTAVLIPLAIFFFPRSGETIPWPVEQQLAIGWVEPWEELEYPFKYPEMKMDGAEFQATGAKVEKGELDHVLFETTLSAHDPADVNVYLDPENAKVYKTGARVYSIRGLEKQTVAAVEFEEEEGFYVYLAESYEPPTLGEFAGNLDLRHTARLGAAFYMTEEGRYTHTAEYCLGDLDALWNFLEENPSAERVNGQVWDRKEELRFEVSIPLAGDKWSETYIGVSGDGYVFSEFLYTINAYYVGREKAAAFIDSVLEDGVEMSVKTTERNPAVSSPPVSSGPSR